MTSSTSRASSTRSTTAPPTPGNAQCQGSSAPDLDDRAAGDAGLPQLVLVVELALALVGSRDRLPDREGGVAGQLGTGGEARLEQAVGSVELGAEVPQPVDDHRVVQGLTALRSEERRVGKAGRAGEMPCDEVKEETE